MQAPRLNFTQASEAPQAGFFLALLRSSPALGLSIFFVMFVLFLWLATQLTTSFFQKGVEATQSEIRALQPKRLLDLENSILRIPPQIDFAKKKFREHIYATSIFDFLRENTLKRVMLTGVEFQQGAESKISVKGSAESFEDLAKQLSFLNARKDSSQIEVSNISLSEEGLVGFNLSYVLSPKILLAP